MDDKLEFRGLLRMTAIEFDCLSVFQWLFLITVLLKKGYVGNV